MNARIVAIEAFELRVPLPRVLRMGGMEIAHRDYALVRVRDGDGAVGSAYGLTRNSPVAQMLAQAIAPRWVGQPLVKYAGLYRDTVRANVCLGTHGVFWRALSVADCAIHDLLARRAGQSLAAYLGGAMPVVPSLLVGGYPAEDATDDRLAAEMKHLARRHPAGIKIAGCGDLARDTHRLRVCRAALGAEIPLMIDCGWSAPRPEVFAAEARGWADLNIGWVEDPYGFDDFAETAALGRALPFPVAVGDERSGEKHFENLMTLGGIDVVRLDATVCGGLGTFRRIAARAAERGLSVAGHIFPELHTQLAAVVPNLRWVEEIPAESDIDAIHHVCRLPVEWRDDGMMSTATHGIGYAWDEEAVRRFTRCHTVVAE